MTESVNREEEKARTLGKVNGENGSAGLIESGKKCISRKSLFVNAHSAPVFIFITEQK